MERCVAFLVFPGVQLFHLISNTKGAKPTILVEKNTWLAHRNWKPKILLVQKSRLSRQYPLNTREWVPIWQRSATDVSDEVSSTSEFANSTYIHESWMVWWRGVRYKWHNEVLSASRNLSTRVLIWTDAQNIVKYYQPQLNIYVHSTYNVKRNNVFLPDREGWCKESSEFVPSWTPASCKFLGWLMSKTNTKSKQRQMN